MSESHSPAVKLLSADMLLEVCMSHAAGDHAKEGLREGQNLRSAGDERDKHPDIEVDVQEVVDREADGHRETVAANSPRGALRRSLCRGRGGTSRGGTVRLSPHSPRSRAGD